MSHSTNDTSAVDTLANFETAVRSAQTELQREQQRYESLIANVKAVEAKVKASQGAIADAADRCETLENECNRIAHANDQRREQVNYHRKQMEQLTAPRTAIEEETATTSKAVSATRKELCSGAMRTTAEVLASLRDHNPTDLKARLALKQAEEKEVLARVSKYRADLAQITRLAAVAAANAAKQNDSTTDNTTTAADKHHHDDENDTAVIEDRSVLAKEVARLEARLASLKANNAERSQYLAQQRDALRARIRRFGQSMPASEQLAQNAENSYNELLDQCQGVDCRQCGGELGYEPLMMA